MGTAIGPRMAVQTIYLESPGVDLVAERNRLRRLIPRLTALGPKNVGPERYAQRSGEDENANGDIDSSLELLGEHRPNREYPAATSLDRLG